MSNILEEIQMYIDDQRLEDRAVVPKVALKYWHTEVAVLQTRLDRISEVMDRLLVSNSLNPPPKAPKE